MMWDATRKRGEKATVEKLRLGMKSASAKSLVNGRSQVRAVTCHLNDAEKRRPASKQRAVEENESSVTARSRCWGKAAAPNDVIILSSSSSSPSSIVKFDVTENSQQQASQKKKKKKLANRTSKGVALQQQGVERRHSVCNYAVGAVK
jgi:hypothetical protein